MDSPYLLQLPMEILAQIAEHLGPCDLLCRICASPDDRKRHSKSILSFRLAHSTLELASVTAFQSTYFASRTCDLNNRPGNAHLRSLDQIAAHPLLSRAVHTVSISLHIDFVGVGLDAPATLPPLLFASTGLTTTLNSLPNLHELFINGSFLAPGLYSPPACALPAVLCIPKLRLFSFASVPVASANLAAFLRRHRNIEILDLRYTLLAVGSYADVLDAMDLLPKLCDVHLRRFADGESKGTTEVKPLYGDEVVDLVVDESTSWMFFDRHDVRIQGTVEGVRQNLQEVRGAMEMQRYATAIRR